MARIFVTGSTTGIGKNAAQTLRAAGHEVIFHARNPERARDLDALGQVLTGDLGGLAEVRALARDLNALGPMDAIIHNAGIIDAERVDTADGLLRVLMVNALAPYMLSLLVDRPARLIFTGSSMHRGHSRVLEDIGWTDRRWSASSAYGESKLLVTALSAALARKLDGVACHTVDPGWVPTRMGGASASDPLDQAHLTQCWLATTAGPETAEDATGGYWHHMRRQRPDPKVEDIAFQDRVLDHFAQMTGVSAP